MTKGPLTLPPGWVKGRLYHLLAPLVALAVVGLVAHFTTLIELMEDGTVDLRFRMRAPFDPPADQRIVFVGIDEISLSHFGKWPWPREVEADFLKTIAASGMTPATIAFDLMFTEASDKMRMEQNSAAQNDDQVLGDAAGLFPSVITGAFSLGEPVDASERQSADKATLDALANPGLTQPLPNIIGDIAQLHGSNDADLPVPPIRSQSFFAFVNDDPSNVDDIRHTIPLVLRIGDKAYASLSLEALCQLLGVDPDKVTVDLNARKITLKNLSGKTWTIPINERAEFAINYRREDTFQTVSLFGLMQNIEDHLKTGAPIAPACQVDKKVLLVGEDAVALGDMGPSPLSGRSPLPFAHLNVINNVLKGDYISTVPTFWVVLGWLAVTWITLLRLKVARFGEAVAAPIVNISVYVIAAFVVFWLWSIQIALAWPVLAYGVVNFWGVVLRWREEQRGREQLKQVFSRMVSPEIMNHLLAHPENMKLGGSDRPTTILFSDVRDYTKFSEGLSAAEVMNQLNDYFESMVGCVNEGKGTLHKFIGDAVMAVWGDIDVVSQGSAEDARNAVRSALLMRKRLRELNDLRQEKGLVPLRIGIGLNHGVVQAGMLGSSGRMEFTVIGDEVNTASRLEGITKEFKTDLAVSESVRNLLGDDFLVRRLGLIVLKGKSKPTVVYEVLAEANAPLSSKMRPEIVAVYEQAFTDFLARRFKEAEAGFAICNKEYPNDHCIENYHAASRSFVTHPPPEEWDGRIIMMTK